MYSLRISTSSFVTSLIVVVMSLQHTPSLADITGTAPEIQSCLCMTSSSIYIRETACGDILHIGNTGDCYRYNGGRTTCMSGEQEYEFFRIDYKKEQSGWVVGNYLQVDDDSLCGPRPDELRVIVLGDWGEILLQGQDMVANGMAVWANTSHPKWIVTTGDNIYPKGIDSWDDPQMDIKWRNVYYQDSIKDLPWYVNLGNHDYGDWLGEEWNMVELSKHDPQWILPHLWYDFVEEVGDHTVHFILFDTETFGHQINNYTDMMDWFETTLRDSTADWKLVVGHRHVFSVGDVLYGAVTDNLFDYMVPLMDRYGVAAYVCGHDHNLQHLKNITGEGLDYVLSGAGGALPSRYVPGNAEYLRDVYGVEALFFETTYGFMTLTTRQSQLIFDYFDQDANLLYTFARPQTKKTRS